MDCTHRMNLKYSKDRRKNHPLIILDSNTKAPLSSGDFTIIDLKVKCIREQMSYDFTNKPKDQRLLVMYSPLTAIMYLTPPYHNPFIDYHTTPHPNTHPQYQNYITTS